MNILLSASLMTAIALGATAPLVSANPISITTDRVQVRVSENGVVQIRTAVDRPVGFNVEADRPALWPTALTPLPYSGQCYPRMHSHQSQSRQITPTGDRVYSETYSSTRLCQ